MPTRRMVIAGTVAASLLPAATSPASVMPDRGITVDRFPIWPGSPPGPPGLSCQPDPPCRFHAASAG